MANLSLLSKIKTMLLNLTRFITRFPKSVLLCLFLLMLAALWPASQIKADFSLEGFYPKDAPTLTAYQDFIAEFGRDDNVIALVLETRDVLDPIFLSSLSQVSDRVTQIDGVAETISLLSAQRLTNQDGELVTQAWLEEIPTGAINRDSLLQQWKSDPFLADLLINQAGTVTAMYIELDQDRTNYTTRQAILDELLPLVEPLKQQASLYITGIPYFRNMYVNRLNEQIVFYISLSTVLIVVLLWFLYRNWRDVVLPIGIVWLSILFSVALIQLSGGFFEIMSSTIAPILLCVGIADTIHIMSKYNDERLQGTDHQTSIERSMVTLGVATLMTSVTTAIGFATLTTSDVLPMRNFGIYTAMGVLLAFIITIVTLPALLKVTGNKIVDHPAKKRIHIKLGSFLTAMEAWVYAHHKAIVSISLLLSLFFGYGITKLKVNSHIFDDVGKDSDLIKAATFASENLSPQFPLEILIPAPEGSTTQDPGFVAKLDTLHQYLETIPEFRTVISQASIMRETHRLMEPERSKQEVLPTQAAQLAQYQLLLEVSGADAASDYTNFDYSTSRVSVLTEDMGSHKMGLYRAQIEEKLTGLFPDANIIMTGTNILVSDLTNNIVYTLASSILLAILIIGGLMWLMFRKASLFIISLLPNLVPLIIVAGVMGYLQIWIKPSTAVIFTIAFGIAVDDTIHFLARLKIEAGEVRSLRSLIQVTLEKTGRSIILTSLILIAGFGTLTFSDFESTQYMGYLVSLTIGLALVADLLFLPALLYWIKPKLNQA
jgi:hypothetical protein